MEKRIKLVFTLFLLFFIVIVLRLFFWQIISFDRLAGIGEKQRLVSFPMLAARGKISASDGSPLVINQPAYGVILEPKSVTSVEATVSILAKELNLDSASISARLNNDSLLWIPIAHKIEETKIDTLKSYKLKGVVFSEESKRFYPEASMAAQLLGFVGKNTKGEDKGYFGLEGYYDEQLRGRDGLISQEEDALGNPILAGERQIIPAENGRSFTLYLDKTVQYIVEKQLKLGIEKYGAKGGTVTVMDPTTGGIIAMASFPAYDPGEIGKYEDELYKNPIVSSSYEPGSTFKVLVMAMALNEKVIDGETKYNEIGPIEMGGYTIKTWNQKYHGLINLREILEYSSNVGMVFLASKLPKDNFLSYLGKLGLGKKTGVDLQEEVSPELRPKSKWYEIDYATASFGQGIAVTPLQMVRAVAAIANGGKLMEPHIVKKIHLTSGESINISPKIERVVFKTEATNLVTEMMVAAVDNGEAKRMKPPGYRIAGKTGTAQIPIAGHYDTEKTIASFVGFAPVGSPKFVMLVSLSEPTTSPWGSETAAPIFFAIAKELFSYYGISPSD